jgi:hypothetical protein
MRFGYTTPDGTIMDLKYNIFFESGDGNNTSSQLHDTHGIPILDTKEIILMEIKEIFDFSDRWSFAGTKTIFSGAGGRGTAYVTNNRIIGLRVSSPGDEALAGSNIFSFPSVIGKYLDGKARKEMQIRQFIEIPYNEIVKIDTQTNFMFILFNLTCWKLQVFKTTMEKIIELNQSREVSRDIKGFSRWKYHHIYYIDKSKMVEKPYDKRKELVEKAMKYAQDCKKDKAIAEYRKVLSLFPNDEYCKKRIRILSGEVYNEKPIEGQLDPMNNSTATVSISQEVKKG